MRVLAGLLLLGLLGCSTYQWRNSDISRNTQENFYQSKTDCQMKAQITYGNAKGFDMGHGIAKGSYFKQCMAGQGWFEYKVKPQEAQKCEIKETSANVFQNVCT